LDSFKPEDTVAVRGVDREILDYLRDKVSTVLLVEEGSFLSACLVEESISGLVFCVTDIRASTLFVLTQLLERVTPAGIVVCYGLSKEIEGVMYLLALYLGVNYEVFSVPSYKNSISFTLVQGVRSEVNPDLKIPDKTSY